MFNSAIGSNDYWSTSGTRSQSTPLQFGTTRLDQIRNSPTTAELLSDIGRRTSAYQWARSENPRPGRRHGPEDVATHSETRDNRFIRNERSDRVDKGQVESDHRWRRDAGGDGSNRYFNSGWAGNPCLIDT